jgi:hypothetical protein
MSACQHEKALQHKDNIDYSHIEQRRRLSIAPAIQLELFVRHMHDVYDLESLQNAERRPGRTWSVSGRNRPRHYQLHIPFAD